MKTYRLLELQTPGADWLDGGDFGYEGSLIAVLLQLIAIGYYLYKHPELYRPKAVVYADNRD